jgi:hypothetical protein
MAETGKFNTDDIWGHWTNDNFLCNSNLGCTWNYSLSELGYDIRKRHHGVLIFPSVQALLFHSGQFFLPC